MVLAKISSWGCASQVAARHQTHDLCVLFLLGWPEFVPEWDEGLALASWIAQIHDRDGIYSFVHTPSLDDVSPVGPVEKTEGSISRGHQPQAVLVVQTMGPNSKTTGA